MTTNMKAFVISAIVICIVMISCACAMPAYAEEQGEFYPRLSVVIDTDPEIDVVYCVDKNGNQWSFFGIDMWKIGDLCNLLMWNNSEDIRNHEIIEIYFEGWMAPDDFLNL